MDIEASLTKIVLTPVRNEAWVLRAFLEATSLWADTIIIADQMSTDGSREIAESFQKVILVENTRKEMHQAATRKLLFDEAKKIEGEKVLFAIDADEFLSGDFVNTSDWEKIMLSKPGDCFCWRWMNLKVDDITQYSTHQPYYWAIHVSDDLWDGLFPDNFIHEWRLPWPQSANKVIINDFYSIHLARINSQRQRNKERFYQVSTLAQDPRKSIVSLYRQYHAEEELEYFNVPDDAYRFYDEKGLNIWNDIDTSDEGEYYTSEILRYFKRDGVERYAYLDIWDERWMMDNGLKDPRKMIHKVILGYLSKTQKKRTHVMVRIIDKMLKLFI